MKNRQLRVVTLLCVLLFSTVSFAQIMIKGTVKGEDGYGIPGASVLVKETANGTVTDIDGNFSISVPSDKSTLEFRFIGYQTQTIKVGKKTVFDIILKEDSEMLDEVVVVGYGQMKKSDLTGAIGSYRPNENEASKVASIDNMLQGKIAGLSVGTSVDAPGAASSVTIRGANSLRGDNQPLYVIDNIPQASTGEFASTGDDNIAIATNALSSLNPNDIESIEVLKDASATAIYGSRGANGVILITTKKGKSGKTSVNVSANFTITDASNLLEMMNLHDYAVYSLIRGGVSPNEGLWKVDKVTGETVWNDYYKYFIDENNDVWRKNGEDSKLNEPWSRLQQIDWQKEIYSTSFSQNYAVTLNGGTDKVTYFASASYKDIEGLVQGTGLKQGDFRLNLNADLSKKIKLAISLNGSIKDNDMMAGGNSVGGATGAVSGVALSSAPYNKSQEELDQITDIASRATVWTWVDEFDDKTTEKTFRGSIDLSWNIVKWLSYNLRAGGNISLQDRDRWYGLPLYEGSIQHGYVTQSSFDRSNYTVENMLQFNHEVKDIVSINATAGVTYDAYTSLSKVVVGNKFNVFDLRSNGLHLAGNKEYKQPLQDDYQLLSALGRANLSFLNGRYLLTASIRADGSSKFKEGNRWAYFPAATVAWRMEQEKFMHDVSWLNQLKIRAGYGKTGSQSISSYSTFAPYASLGDDGKPAQSASGDGTKLIGLIVNKLANEGLKWETTASYNIGMDFAFLDSRISGSVDVYSKTTSNLLIQRDLPPSTGYKSMTVNQGKLRNKGIEVSLNGDIIRNRTFTWSLSGNISFNRGKILDFGLPEKQWGVNDDGSSRMWKAYLGASLGNHFHEANIFVADHAPGLFYGYQTDGIIQENDPYLSQVTNSVGTLGAGNLKFVDRNGDKKIDEKDKTIIGNPNPDFTYGIQTSFTWKSLTLSLAFNGVYGNDILNANARYYNFPSQSNGMVLAESYRNMYHEENPWNGAANYSRTTTSPNSTVPQVVFDSYVEDGSFLRCTDITLGYDLPKNWVKKIRFSNIGVFASAKNLFCINNYSGYDPEVNTFAFDGTRPGIDLSSYPHTRSFIFGLNVSF